MNNGYSICFNEWALDKEIKNELGLLLIISSLCAKKGFCYASNEYLSKIFDEPKETISRKIKKLESKEYIFIEYKKRGCHVLAREITINNFDIRRLTKMSFDDYQKCHSTINKNVKENIISNNNININKRESKERKSPRPSLEEIQVYVKEKELQVDPKQFFDYFEAGDWKDAKGQVVKSWKQKILTWNKFEENNRKTRQDIQEAEHERMWNELKEKNKEWKG